MRNNNKSKRKDSGQKIKSVFDYVQQIFRESAQLIRTLDKLMEKDWVSAYGGRITKEVTSDLNFPDYWLVEAIFRIYKSKKQNNIRKGITIVYWGESIDQPILIGGTLDYYLDKKTGLPNKSDHWDIYYSWFEDGLKEKISDGTPYDINYESDGPRNYLKKGRFFALPLIEIRSEENVKSKIYEMLMKDSGN